MLVLSRKPQQKIRIGDDVVVSIVRVKGNTVRVGIEAPQDVRVVRGELPVFTMEGSPESSAAGEVCDDEASDCRSQLSLRSFIESRSPRSFCKPQPV